MRLGSRNFYEIIRGKIHPNKKELNWNIQWTEDLIRNYYKDEEIPVVSYVFLMIVLFRMIEHSFNDRTFYFKTVNLFFRHNDPNPGNMMMDRDDFTAESLILIDWDLTQYGYRLCSRG